jgi:hypothetical protein
VVPGRACPASWPTCTSPGTRSPRGWCFGGISPISPGIDNGLRGHDQAIDFNAIDIQHVGDGTRITERLAPEGNLTFLQQAGLVTIAGSK